MLAAIFAAHACKTEAGDSTYMITPLREKEQPAEGAESVLDVPTEVVAHIFMDVEGANWKPLSYADALAGVLSDTISEVRGTLNADATFEQREDGSLLMGALQGERRHYIVVCDKEDEVYGWRELRTVGDAGTIYLGLYFRPWREPTTPTQTFDDTGWKMVYKYVPKEDPKQDEDGEDEEDGDGDEEDGEE